jgi:hypothetical protein
VLTLGDNNQFSQMYKGPKSTSSNNSPIDLENVINAFLGLGLEVR